MPGWLQRPNLILLVLAVLALAALALNHFYRLQLQQQAYPPSGEAAGAIIGQHRPDFVLPDALGLSHRPEEWDGRVLVVTFWATWCKPCIREMPAFVELQRQYAEHGVQFVGIALDTADLVEAFFNNLEIMVNFPILIGGEEAVAVAQAYGNEVGVLPYTVMTDKQGRIAYAHYGELTRDTAEQMILELL